MFAIYYRENETPAEMRVGMISAPNETVAYSVAQTLFSGSTIIGVVEVLSAVEETKYPGAKFINGEFLPVRYHDEVG